MDACTSLTPEFVLVPQNAPPRSCPVILLLCPAACVRDVSACGAFVVVAMGCHSADMLWESFAKVLVSTPCADTNRIVLLCNGHEAGQAFQTIKALPGRFAGLSLVCSQYDEALSSSSYSFCPEQITETPVWVSGSTLGALALVKALRGAGNARVVSDISGDGKLEHVASDPAWCTWVKARHVEDLGGRDIIRLRYRSDWAPALLLCRRDRGQWPDPGSPLPSFEPLDSAVARVLREPLQAEGTALSQAEGTAFSPSRWQWQVIEVAASVLEFCATDGRGRWDNAPGGKNYVIMQPGSYEWENGELRREHSVLRKVF